MVTQKEVKPQSKIGISSIRKYITLVVVVVVVDGVISTR